MKICCLEQDLYISFLQDTRQLVLPFEQSCQLRTVWSYDSISVYEI